MNPEPKQHKAGYVNILGNPNVGKSTLMNALLGEKISIVTHKAQTTRHRILGIFNDEAHQIVFSDTPGLLVPQYALHESMMQSAKSALSDADVLLIMTTPKETELNDESILEALQKTTIPLIILVNKVDLSNPEEVTKCMALWKGWLPEADIRMLSALEQYGTQELLEDVKAMLPLHPPYFDKEQLTDKSERFIVEEKIREKILIQYKKEIPYATEVVVEEFKDERDILKIYAAIYTERKSQKAILVGHQGKAISSVGREARKDLERFFQKKIFLQLRVKLKENWRSNPRSLNAFGYKDK